MKTVWEQANIDDTFATWHHHHHQLFLAQLPRITSETIIATPSTPDKHHCHSVISTITTPIGTTIHNHKQADRRHHRALSTLDNTTAYTWQKASGEHLACFLQKSAPKVLNSSTDTPTALDSLRLLSTAAPMAAWVSESTFTGMGSSVQAEGLAVEGSSTLACELKRKRGLKKRVSTETVCASCVCYVIRERERKKVAIRTKKRKKKGDREQKNKRVCQSVCRLFPPNCSPLTILTHHVAHHGHELHHGVSVQHGVLPVHPCLPILAYHKSPLVQPAVLKSALSSGGVEGGGGRGGVKRGVSEVAESVRRILFSKS